MSSTVAKGDSGRYITRRVLDEEGNIVVRRYKRRESFFSRLNIPWHRYFAFLIGSFFGFYAYSANLFNSGELERLGGLSEGMEDFFTSFNATIRFFLAGTVAIVLGVWLGWLLITRGFYLRSWGKGTRQLIAVVAVVFLMSAVFSGLVNEQGITRHEDETTDIDREFDVSDLSAPFNLFGNINPESIIAEIELQDPGTLNQLEDTYLWRWYVPETYDNNAENKFIKGYEGFQTSFNGIEESDLQSSPLSLDQTQNYKHFRVSQQILALTNQYSGDGLTPWNSIYEAPINLNNPTFEGEAQLVDGTVKASRDINQHPIISASIDSTESSGFLEYDAFWVEEFKDQISENSISYSEMETLMQSDAISDLGTSRFGNIKNQGTYSEIWGLDSLGGQSYITEDAIFNERYQEFNTAFEGSNSSVYEVVFAISQRVQVALIDAFQTNPNLFTGSSESAGLSLAGQGQDAGQFFWQALDSGAEFGLLDMIAGFHNMIRSFDVPARPVLGFSVGDIEGTTITLKGEHLTMWVETLIPWLDSNNEMQLSWGIFNLIPNIDLFLSNNVLIYGKNSLNSNAEMVLEFANGLKQNLPDDIGEINGQNEFVVAQKNQPLNFSAAVLFENQPSVGQTINFRLINETELLSLSENNIDFDIGTHLGSLQSDSDGYANMSITAGDGWTHLSWENGTSRNITDFDIVKFNPAGAEGERNVYAIAATFGISFAVGLVGWSLEGNITLNALTVDELTVIGDTALNGGDPTPVIFSIPGEEIEYNATFTTPNGDPVSGQTFKLALITTSQVGDAIDAIQGGDLQFLNDITVATFENLTDASGSAKQNYTFVAGTGQNQVQIGKYYSLIAYIDGSTSFGELIVHMTNDLVLGAVANYGGDQLVYFDENQTVPIDVSSIITDNTLAPFTTGLTPRVADGLPLYVYIMEKAVAEANNNTANMITLLDDTNACTTDLDASSTCYRLTTAGMATHGFGIIGGEPVTDQNNPINIQLQGQVVSLGSYYIIIYSPDFQVYNTTERFGFFPGNQPSLLGLNGEGIDQNNQPKLQLDHNRDFTSISYIMAIIGVLKLIRKEVRK